MGRLSNLLRGSVPRTWAGHLNAAAVDSLTLDAISAGAAPFPITGKSATSGNTAGGAINVTAGAGSGTGAGGALTFTAGASGAGATGNGGAATVTGGAAASTNGNGGAAGLVGGVGRGTGTGGAISLTGGASAGASGTAGSVNINPGAAAGGTPGAINLGNTNACNVVIAAACGFKLPQTEITTAGFLWYDAGSNQLKYRDNVGTKTITAA
jgi:hypothetical protein